MYLLTSYDNALKEILDRGVSRTNARTGLKTLSIFGMCNRYRLDTEYFPIMTRRRIWPPSVLAELLWFLSGSTSNRSLKVLGCNFWTPWVDHEWEAQLGYAKDTFGPVYGFQLRHFDGIYGNGIGGFSGTQETQKSGGASYYGLGGFDQLAWVIDSIKNDISSRRALWVLWNPKDIPKMRLPPCHLLYQVLVDDDRRLTGILYQRSADFPIGVPANIQFYSALTVMIAQQTDCKPYEFVHMTADSHIYENQIEAVKTYLDSPVIDSPKLTINKASDIFNYGPLDFVLEDYAPGPKIEIPVAV